MFAKIARPRVIVAALLSLLLLWSFWFLFVRPLHYLPAAPPAFQNDEERREFHRLLRKHGMDRQIAVIHEDRQGWYFVRDGRRCAFR